jgi:hypothetical protein
LLSGKTVAPPKINNPLFDSMALSLEHFAKTTIKHRPLNIKTPINTPSMPTNTMDAPKMAAPKAEAPLPEEQIANPIFQHTEDILDIDLIDDADDLFGDSSEKEKNDGS